MHRHHACRDMQLRSVERVARMQGCGFHSHGRLDGGVAVRNIRQDRVADWLRTGGGRSVLLLVELSWGLAVQLKDTERVVRPGKREREHRLDADIPDLRAE